MSLDLTFQICLITSIIQFCFYSYNNSDKFTSFKKENNLFINDFYLLIVFIIFYSIILPRFFYIPRANFSGTTYCGPSNMDFHMLFLKLGLISSIATHFIWKKLSKYASL